MSCQANQPYSRAYVFYLAVAVRQSALDLTRQLHTMTAVQSNGGDRHRFPDGGITWSVRLVNYNYYISVSTVEPVYLMLGLGRCWKFFVSLEVL